MKIRKRDITKVVLELSATVGITVVVTLAVKKIVPVNMNALGKVVTFIGSYWISTAISNAANTYIEETVDEFAEVIDLIKEQFKEAVKEAV